MIWVVGAAGMLGRELCDTLSRRKIPFVSSDREVDILDLVAIRLYITTNRPTWVVNCAAYTAVDRAEDEEALALRLNADGPANLARVTCDAGVRLLHLSTDYVFPGDSSRPYLESDLVQPTGAYGRTKAAGECAVQEISPDAVIVRTAWLYGKHGPNFVASMLRLMAERESLGVVADQRGTPTWARDLSEAICMIVKTPGFPAGIYHYTDAGETTWFDFAAEIQRLGIESGLLKCPCKVKPLRTTEYPTKARRPSYSVLSKDKISALGIAVPVWQHSLALYLDELKRIQEGTIRDA